MASTKLVRGDTGPQVKVTLTDENNSGAPIDVTGATVQMYFRAVDTTEVLDTLAGTILNGPAGEVVFDWNEDTLDVEEGIYEGEIEVTFASGVRQTVFDVLSFQIREDFA